ncbi:MAG TPA: PGPGW domain-containing protein [Thiolinea sp.]|nr:PGPGW domain-containing protein [Thiolinea sp.]
MLNNITSWLEQHGTFLYWFGIISLFMFVLSLLLLPWLINKIPVNYFKHQEEPDPVRLLKPANILRNAIGLLVLLAGVGMLVLPGQGILCILLGLMIMNFPGKYSLERWVITRKGVLESMNWIRSKGGKPPLQV